MKNETIKTVQDIPENYILVQDSQAVDCLKEYFPGIEFDGYYCFFVLVEDGEYTSIYGCVSYIPYKERPVFKLL
jgi:hypothetical protein